MSKLFIIATPIGNLSDVSDRARQTLQEVDLVLCEDTRVTQKLLNAFKIDKPTESLHQHTDDGKIAKIVDRIKKGQSAAFVSDAGTPGVSDPGGKLVAMAAKAGLEIIPIPGPSAVTTALSVCGFPVDKFTFLGFPPHKKGRTKYFDQVDKIEHAVVFFESKHRIMKTLASLDNHRTAMVARELTKMHETLYRGTIEEIKEQVAAQSQKGEFTIVLAPKNWK